MQILDDLFFQKGSNDPIPNFFSIPLFEITMISQILKYANCLIFDKLDSFIL
jgi:hypothetical protein